MPDSPKRLDYCMLRAIQSSIMVDKYTMAMSFPFEHGMVQSAMRRLARKIAVKGAMWPKL